jgi:serine protease Do
MMYRTFAWLCSLGLASVTLLIPGAHAIDPLVLKSESQRIATVKTVTPAVVAVCSYGGDAVGSGVVIDAEGYALTNYHVTDSISPVMQAGLADGELYDAVIVGHDKVGDVALIKLLPKKPGQPFPFVKLGDSDTVKMGDWSLAMGNPFGLAMDFTPTVTFGLVSGVHRYQPPAGSGILEYTDCIQIDTSINPGNSGGPLFNLNGELIGINGRGSFDKRGRVNSGVGYAISINQIKNFLGHLRAGLDVDHATLGATVITDNEDGALGQMSFDTILSDSDAARRGLRPGDKLISFAGRPMSSTNHYKNILGIFPSEWRLPLAYRRDNTRKDILVRLMPNMDVALKRPAPKQPRPPQPQEGPMKPSPTKSPAMKLFTEKSGYANYYFNEQQQQNLMREFRTWADFSKALPAWNLSGRFDANARQGQFTLQLADDADGTNAKLTMNVAFTLKMPTANAQELSVPENSGGLLAVLTQYRRLLMKGEKGFTREFRHGGTEPIYPPSLDGKPIEDWTKVRQLCEVIRTNDAGIVAKWYFSPQTHELVACEAAVLPDDDPCEVFFRDYQTVDARKLPHRIDVRWGEKNYGTLTITSWN